MDSNALNAFTCEWVVKWDFSLPPSDISEEAGSEGFTFHLLC
jgi:hypothetical protein